MRILLTGASSFTGLWFATALARAGHDVVATFTREDLAAYHDSTRFLRISQIKQLVTPVFGCRFGDPVFINTILRIRPDMLCHHGAEATNYRDECFDYQAALDRNSYRIADVLKSLDTVGCGRVVLTGSVFEAGEGDGSDDLPCFSPYGLSKFLTAATFSYFCRRARMSLGKFVIPNPFGPWEEPRFTDYLIRSWRSGIVPTVRTPDYVRDNIHVSLLAAAYEAFVTQLPYAPGFAKINPSGYVGTQRSFVERYAREIGSRLGWNTAVDFAEQSDFSEPLVRVNTDRLDEAGLNWRESESWDEVAGYIAKSCSSVG